MKEKMNLLKLSKEEKKEVKGGLMTSYCIYRYCYEDPLIYQELNRFARAGSEIP